MGVKVAGDISKYAAIFAQEAADLGKDVGKYVTSKLKEAGSSDADVGKALKDIGVESTKVSKVKAKGAPKKKAAKEGPTQGPKPLSTEDFEVSEDQILDVTPTRKEVEFPGTTTYPSTTEGVLVGGAAGRTPGVEPGSELVPAGKRLPSKYFQQTESEYIPPAEAPSTETGLVPTSRKSTTFIAGEKGISAGEQAPSPQARTVEERLRIAEGSKVRPETQEVTEPLTSPEVAKENRRIGSKLLGLGAVATAAGGGIAALSSQGKESQAEQLAGKKVEFESLRAAYPGVSLGEAERRYNDDLRVLKETPLPGADPNRLQRLQEAARDRVYAVLSGGTGQTSQTMAARVPVGGEGTPPSETEPTKPSVVSQLEMPGPLKEPSKEDIKSEEDRRVELFKRGIFGPETKGVSNPYSAENPESSAVGKYQFLWGTWGNAIRDFAGKPSLSKDAYKNNPELQEAWMEHYAKEVLPQEANELQEKFGPEELRQRGIQSQLDLMALLHYQGKKGADYYLENGSMYPWKDANGRTITNQPVEKYLDKFRQSAGDTGADETLKPFTELRRFVAQSKTKNAKTRPSAAEQESIINQLDTVASEVADDKRFQYEPVRTDLVQLRAEAYKAYKEKANRNEWLDLAERALNAIGQFAAARSATGGFVAGFPQSKTDYAGRTEQAFREYQAELGIIGEQARAEERGAERLEAAKEREIGRRQRTISERLADERAARAEAAAERRAIIAAGGKESVATARKEAAESKEAYRRLGTQLSDINREESILQKQIAAINKLGVSKNNETETEALAEIASLVPDLTVEQLKANIDKADDALTFRSTAKNQVASSLLGPLKQKIQQLGARKEAIYGARAGEQPVSETSPTTATPAGQLPRSVVVQGKTYPRPDGMSDADWQQYITEMGGK
jgi:hypothetical protein